MLKRTMIIAVTANILLLTGGALPAAAQDQQRSSQQTRDQDQTDTPDQLQTRDQQQSKDQDYIYGSELMTEQERAEHRAQIQAARTAEEREQIRMDHHEVMKERARESGMTLPDEPPAAGGGANRGGGDSRRGR